MFYIAPFADVTYHLLAPADVGAWVHCIPPGMPTVANCPFPIDFIDSMDDDVTFGEGKGVRSQTLLTLPFALVVPPGSCLRWVSSGTAGVTGREEGMRQKSVRRGRSES